MTRRRGLGMLRVRTRDIDRWRQLIVGAPGFAESPGPGPDGLYPWRDARRARLADLPVVTGRVPTVGRVVPTVGRVLTGPGRTFVTSDRDMGRDGSGPEPLAASAPPQGAGR